MMKVLQLAKPFAFFCIMAIGYLSFFWSNTSHTTVIDLINTNERVIAELKQLLLHLDETSLNNRDLIKFKLKSIINILIPETTTVNYSTELNQENLPFYTCPETFLHAKYGHPLFMSGSWVIENCSDPNNIAKILSVAMVVPYKVCSKRLRNIILGFKELAPDLPILLSAPTSFRCKLKVQNLHIIESKSSNLGFKLNQVLSNVTTPLVLIGRHLDYYDWFARIKRQLSAFSIAPDVDVVGGSIRNISGHFQVGCYQSHLKYYTLTYIDGYYKSKNECMFCDHLMGPFIAKMEIFDKIKFDENLNDNVIYEDFFLRLKSAAKTIINCPDAMYQATDPGIPKRLNFRTTWLSLVKKYELNRVVLPNGAIFKFTCDESALSCHLLYSLVGAKMMPICCRDAFLDGYRAFHEFAVKNNVLYQIEGGSILGAVKLNDVMPWDMDGDGSYYKEKKYLFSKPLNWSTANSKIYINNINYKAKGFFYVLTDNAYIEFFAKDNLSVDVSGVDDKFRVKPTLIRIGDVWVYGSPSPGLYARNYYGREMLKHSNSYNHLGRKHWYAPYKTSDSFLKCEIKHHACLDQFTQDGNIQFKIP